MLVASALLCFEKFAKKSAHSRCREGEVCYVRVENGSALRVFQHLPFLIFDM